MATDLAKDYSKVDVPVRGPKKDKEPPMQAVAYYGKRDMRCIEVSRPALADSRDVILRVTSSAICGSDLHIYTGAFPRAAMQKGDVMGHEFMGVVDEVGDQVTHVKVGDRVVSCFDIACGGCGSCKRGLFTSCDTTNPSEAMQAMYGDRSAGFFGYSHLTGGYDGGQADYVRVPFGDMNLLKVEDSASDLDVLLLSDILPTAWHANELAEVHEGDVVCIWGAGPVGILAAHCALHRNAKSVTLIDQYQYRLDFATQHLQGQAKGRLHTINRSEVSSVYDRVREVCGAHGPDACIEAVGFHYAWSLLHKAEMSVGLETDPADVMNEIIVSCRKGGRVGVVGAYVGYMNHFNFGALMEKGLALKAGQTPVQRYWKTLYGKVKTGALRPQMVITHEMPLEDGPKGFRMFDDKSGKDQCVKVVLHPRFYYEGYAKGTPTATATATQERG